MSKLIVSLGDLVLDVILPVRLPVLPGQHQEPGTRRVEPGGAAHLMIAARHMGLNVAAAGAVGADVFGRAILDALQAELIDTTHITSVPGSTSTLVIALADQETGEHTLVGDYGKGPEAPYPAGLDATIASADALFIQGYALAKTQVVPMTRRAIGHAIVSEVPIILGVGPFMARVSDADRAWVVERTTLVLMTEDEMPLISQGRSVDDAYDFLLARGPRILVVKQGPAGCTVITQDRLERVPGFQVSVVDSVGAGDCFDAAFLAGYLNGLSLWECGRLANAMRAAAVGKVGAGRNTPTCDDVMTVLRQAGDRIDFPC